MATRATVEGEMNLALGLISVTVREHTRRKTHLCPRIARKLQVEHEARAVHDAEARVDRTTKRWDRHIGELQARARLRVHCHTAPRPL